MKKFLSKFVFLSLFAFSILLLSSNPASAAILGFGSSTANVGVGQQTTINVVLNTQGQNVVGVDAIINFDSSRIQIVNVARGTITQFTSYPLLTTTNPIRISALAFGSGVFNGTGVLATITVRGLALGTSQMTYTFTQGSTTDSNVSQETTAVDLLSSVQAITINGVTPATSTPTSTPRVSGTSTVLPRTALISDEVDMIIIGGVLMLAGLMLYRSGSYVLIGNTIWAYGGQAIWDNSKRKKNAFTNNIFNFFDKFIYTIESIYLYLKMIISISISKINLFFKSINNYLKTISSNFAKLFSSGKDNLGTIFSNIGLKENEKFEKALLKKDKKNSGDIKNKTVKVFITVLVLQMAISPMFFPQNIKADETANSYAVFALSEDSSGNVYAGTTSGVKYYELATNQWENILFTENYRNVYSTAIESDSKIYAGGDFVKAGGVVGADRIAYWNGSAWNAMGTGIDNGQVKVVTLGSGGNVYVGGSFSSTGGVDNTESIAYWDGGAWKSMPYSGYPSNAITMSIKIGPDGTIYAGGYNSDGGFIVYGNGSSWVSLGEGLNNDVYAMDIGTDNILYIGGVFTNAGDDSSADKVAYWDGSKWMAMGSGISSSEVRTIKVASDGKVYVGGIFPNAGGVVETSNLAYFEGGSWHSMDSSVLGMGGIDGIYSLAIGADGKIYVGGRYVNNATSNESHVYYYEGGTWSTLGFGFEIYIRIPITLSGITSKASTLEYLIKDPLQTLYQGADFSSEVSNFVMGTDNSYFSSVTLLEGRSYDVYLKPLNYLSQKSTGTAEIGVLDLPPLIDFQGGDYNGDDLINSIDFGLFLDSYGEDNPGISLNADSQVNSIDFGLYLANFGQFGAYITEMGTEWGF